MPRRRTFAEFAVLVGLVAATAFKLQVSAEEPIAKPAINSIAHGNGVFVAVGDDGWIQTSTNGTDWTPRGGVGSGNLRSIAFGNGVFLAASRSENRIDGSPLINTFSSPDGQSWQHLPRLPVDNGLSSSESVPATLTFGNGRFVLIAGANALVSETGQHWTYTFQHLSPISFQPVFGRNLFVLPVGGRFFTSRDGMSWHEVSNLWEGFLLHGVYDFSLLYHEGLFVSFYYNLDLRWPHISWDVSHNAANWTNIYLYRFFQGNNGFETITRGTYPDIDLSNVSVWGNGATVTLRNGSLEATSAPPPSPVLFIEPDDAGVPTLWIECSPDVDWLLQSRSSLDADSQWETVSAFRTTETVHSVPFDSIATDAALSLFRVILAEEE